MLHCTILYYTILHYTILYYTIPYYMGARDSPSRMGAAPLRGSNKEFLCQTAMV